MTLGITVDVREQEGNKENVRREARDLRNKLMKKERSVSQDDQVRRGRENDSRSRPADDSAYRGTKVNTPPEGLMYCIYPTHVIVISTVFKLRTTIVALHLTKNIAILNKH